MSKVIFLLVTLSSLAYVSATFSSSLNVEPSPSPEGSEPFATTLSQWIVDTVSRKIVAIARFFNLKLRLVRFMVSLWTTENLVLFRNLLEEAVRFGGFILGFLPQSVDDPLYWWVPAVSQFININVGESGPVTGETTEQASEVSEIVTNPPIFFNVPPSSTEDPTNDSNEIETRDKRLITEERTVDQEMTATEENQDTRESILRRYEENIISLDKLINGGR